MPPGSKATSRSRNKRPQPAGLQAASFRLAQAHGLTTLRSKPGPPMTLANMRQNGVHAVTATCEACGHKADVNVDALPESLTVPGRPAPTVQLVLSRQRSPTSLSRVRWPMEISFARHHSRLTSSGTPCDSVSSLYPQLPDVEDLLAERGLDVSYETIRRWVLKFGPLFAKELRRRRHRPTSHWASGRDGSSDRRQGRCHTNWVGAVRDLEGPLELQAAVAARHVPNASSRRTRSVRRDVR